MYCTAICSVLFMLFRWGVAGAGIPADSTAGLTVDVIAYCLQSGATQPSHQVYTIDINGSNNQRFIEPSIGLNHFAFSPDGMLLAVTGYMDVTNTTWSIHLYDCTTGTLTRLTSTDGVWDAEPSWSPDGKKLVYAAKDGKNWDIFSCNIDGSDERRLISTPSMEFAPQWSPDGTQLIFTSDRDGNNEIYCANADGSSPARLTDNTSNEYTPRWSRDTSLIVYASDREGAGRMQIFIMNPDGSGERRITAIGAPGSAICPVWKPRLAKRKPE